MLLRMRLTCKRNDADCHDLKDRPGDLKPLLECNSPMSGFHPIRALGACVRFRPITDISGTVHDPPRATTCWLPLSI